MVFLKKLAIMTTKATPTVSLHLRVHLTKGTPLFLVELSMSIQLHARDPIEISTKRAPFPEHVMTFGSLYKPAIQAVSKALEN